MGDLAPRELDMMMLVPSRASKMPEYGCMVTVLLADLHALGVATMVIPRYVRGIEAVERDQGKLFHFSAEID